MNWLVKLFGLDRLLNAVLREFNLGFALSIVADFLRRWRDQRIDNVSLFAIAEAASAKAEVLSPDGGGAWKYRVVFDAIVAESNEWLREEVSDVGRAFAATIDNVIQMVHAKVDRISHEHGTTMLGSMAAGLDGYAKAFEVVRSYAEMAPHVR